MSWIEEAKQAIIDSSETSSVYIGADSIRFKKKKNKQERAQWYARYTTVIVIHKDSRHGCKIYYNTETLPDFDAEKKPGNVRHRMMTEVNYAIEAASEVLDVLGNRHLEIHLDINPSAEHRSSVAVKEALGWCTGLGFDAKIKPDGWAATHAADHAVRHFN